MITITLGIDVKSLEASYRSRLLEEAFIRKNPHIPTFRPSKEYAKIISKKNVGRI